MGFHERLQANMAWEGSRTPGIQDGKDAERAVLGEVTHKTDGEYMEFNAAVAYAREHQPDPFNRSEIVKNLREKIAQQCQSKNEPVRYLTALGTPLDLYHGVDALFEQGQRRVTLDISLAEKDAFKADVVLRVQMDDEGSVTVDPDELERVAREIATRLSVH